jgi:transposase-like protein
MAKTSELKMTTDERRRRRFSPSFKEKKVREIQQKQTTISQICLKSIACFTLIS